MKRLILGVAITVSAAMLIPTAASASEIAYTTFAGCSEDAPVASHECQVGDPAGAFFEADADTEYETCVEFPDEEFFCSLDAAEANVLYVNAFTTFEPGLYFVSWWDENEEFIAAWEMEIVDPTPPESPPAPVTPAPIVPAPLPPTPAQNAKCLAAKRQVGKLKSRLRKASGRKQKAKLRAKLRKARGAKNRAC